MVDYVSGTLYKRRGGFGKYMGKKWEKRGFILSSEGVLAYYDTEVPPSDFNVTVARGFIDLKATPFHLQSGNTIDGMPTPYTIQICPIHDAKVEQWKICTETAADFDSWTKALEVFATIPQTPLTPSHYTSDAEDDENSAGWGHGSNNNNNSNNNSSGSGSGSQNPHGAVAHGEAGVARVSRSSSNTPAGMGAQADGGEQRGRSVSPAGRVSRNIAPIAPLTTSVAALISPARVPAGAFTTPNPAGGGAAVPVPPPRPVTAAGATAAGSNAGAASATGGSGGGKSTGGAPAGGTASASASVGAGAGGTTQPQVVAGVPATRTAGAATRRRVGGLKLKKAEGGLMTQDQAEVASVALVLNICLIAAMITPFRVVTLLYVAIANAVVVHTLWLRSNRLAVATAAAGACAAAPPTAAGSGGGRTSITAGQVDSNVTAPASALATPGNLAEVSTSSHPHTSLTAGTSDGSSDIAAATGPALSPEGKPIAGSTFTQVYTNAPNVPEHTWCKCDYREFNVRVGPNYDRYKKKAPSAAPLYEPFAVDVICTKSRKDHISQRMSFGFDTAEVDTHNPHVPPVLVIQMQIPSEPPASLWSTVEDGPGWAIVMYFRITEDTCTQLKDLATASPAVKLFQQYCEKAATDATWRARFKVICSCLNLDQMGFPSMIVSYNAKPVLIRRTGTFYRGPDYCEFDVHVHKFANLAKQSIHMISSRCGQMYMQIGFVVEGREDSELPETLFACVGVNKPQEDRGEFLFPEDQEED